MPESHTWKYYDKRDLPPWLRRRAPIGRLEVQPLDWKRKLATVIPPDWQQEFIHDVLAAFEWLCPEERAPDQWSLWELSNGGVFLAPVSPQRYRVIRSDRNFDEFVLAETVGLLSTLLAVNWRQSMPEHIAAANWLVALERKLLAFKNVHPDDQ